MRAAKYDYARGLGLRPTSAGKEPRVGLTVRPKGKLSDMQQPTGPVQSGVPFVTADYFLLSINL